MSRKHVTRLRESPTDENKRYLFPGRRPIQNAPRPSLRKGSNPMSVVRNTSLSENGGEECVVGFRGASL